jgi:tetratricopeptide (TPR) repeat protein
MLLRNQLRILISVYILTCAPYCMAKEETWYEVKSPNFTIISNASIRQARRVATSLEQFRAVFQSTLTTLRVDPGFPLTVFAVRDQLSLKALLPEDRKEKGATQPTGIFLPYEGKNIVVLRTDIRSDDRYRVIYHEYVHMAMNLNFQSLPLWLVEGLAELYSYATIKDGASGLGLASRKLVETLKASMIPLPTLMAVTRSSPYYRQQDKSKVFYAQSWALTHYLALGDKGAHAKQLIEFLGLIKRDVSEQEAAARSFGDLNALQQNLEKYIRSDIFYFYRVEKRLSVKESQYSARTLSSAEALALRGELLVRTNRLDDAKTLLERALQLDPRSAVANEGMGLLFLRLGNLKRSQNYFSAAANLDSKSFLAQYYAAKLSYTIDKDYSAAENYLHKALAINPKYAPAYHMLSRILLLQGSEPSEALELAREAANLEPAEPGHRINEGQILLVMARYDEARRLAERLLARARNETEYRQAESLLSIVNNRQNSTLEARRRTDSLRQESPKAAEQHSAAGELQTVLDNQALMPPVPEIEMDSAGMVEGLIVFVKCDYPAIMDVVLDSNGERHKLRSENFSQVQWMGEPPEKTGLQRCKDLEGMRVQIDFVSIPGKDYSGLIKTIRILK